MRKNLYFAKPFILLAIGLLVSVFFINFFYYFPSVLANNVLFTTALLLICGFGGIICVILFDLIDYLAWK